MTSCVWAVKVQGKRGTAGGSLYPSLRHIKKEIEGNRSHNAPRYPSLIKAGEMIRKNKTLAELLSLRKKRFVPSQESKKLENPQKSLEQILAPYAASAQKIKSVQPSDPHATPLPKRSKNHGYPIEVWERQIIERANVKGMMTRKSSENGL